MLKDAILPLVERKSLIATFAVGLGLAAGVLRVSSGDSITWGVVNASITASLFLAVAFGVRAWALRK